MGEVPAIVLPALEVIRATPRTRIIRMALQQHDFPFVAGQAVSVGLHDGIVRKPYSLACSPHQAAASGSLELLAQVEESDTPDPHLERALPGTLLEVSGPFGTFRLPDPFMARDLLFIAGGTGIAPLRALLWEALESGHAARITVLYSARSPEELAYGSELAGLAAEGRIALVETVTRGATQAWSGRRGRIDAGLIARVLRTPRTHGLICGPPAFVTAMTALLTDAGVPDTLIVVEGC